MFSMFFYISAAMGLGVLAFSWAVVGPSAVAGVAIFFLMFPLQVKKPKTHTHAPVAQKAPGVYQVPRREHAAKELHHAVEQIKGVAEHCVAPKQAHKLHYETHHGDHQGCKDGGAPKGELGGAASTGVPGRYIGGCVVECQYRCYKVTAGQ
jgi:hypothetical protein